ncbi:hypothetical protein D9M71_747450 [compost metagenome]
MAEQHGDAVVIADAQEGIGGEHIALVFRAQGKAMGAGDDKSYHQPAAQHGTALEKATTRQWIDTVHGHQASCAARLTAARILG